MLYDRLAAAAGMPRDEAKPLFLAVVYGRPGHADTRVGRAFGREYPETFRAVTRWKRAGDPADLARDLQRREAWVMIGTAAGCLTREYPDLPFATAHDAVLCRPADASAVAGVIEGSWWDCYGVVPRLKTTAWAN